MKFFKPEGRFGVQGVGKIDVSIIDVANLCLFVRAADVGLDHEEALAILQADKTVVSRLEAIRATVSAELDFIKGENAAEELLVNMNPLLFVEGTPRSYQAIDGATIEGDNTDLFARSITRALFSKNHLGTGNIATMVSCGISGTIPTEMIPGGTRPFGQAYKIRIGHPSGIMELEASLMHDDQNAIQRYIQQLSAGPLGCLWKEWCFFGSPCTL